MFSGELQSDRHSLSSRASGIILGTILLLAVAASLVSAKTVPFVFFATVVGFLCVAMGQGEARQALPAASSVAIHLAVFLLYALLSAAWSTHPDLAASKALLALLISALTMGLMALIGNKARPNLLHMGEGIWIGLLVGLLYLLFELLTDQSIKLWLYRTVGLGPDDLNPAGFFTWSDGRLISISTDDLTRNITPAVLILWPAVMIIRASWPRPWNIAGAGGLVLLTAIVVALSWHESSKLALLAGMAAFGVSQLSLRWAQRLMIAAWLIACFAVVPAALMAHRLDLHDATWLQASARHRLIIWNFTAEKMFESPWVGVGANMTYVLGPELEKATPAVPGETLRRTLSVHSHSIFLQTWFELGLVGAALLALFGLALLNAIHGLGAVLQPYAYATFASAGAMTSSSYGMWQLWFMALFGFCAVTFAIGARLLEQRCGREQN